MNQKMVDKLEEITKDMRGATDGMEEYLAIAKEMVSVSEKLDSKPEDLATSKSLSRYFNQPDEPDPEQPAAPTEPQPIDKDASDSH